MKIGVVINHLEDSDSGAIPAYTEIREMTQAAEAGGLDSIWLFDHLLFRFDDNPTRGIWECWTLLSALSEATKRVELGILVLCNPFRNPAVRAVRRYLKDPRFMSCDRVSPFSFRSSDVGVVLDLMIHDLDIVLHLIRSPLQSVHAVGGRCSRLPRTSPRRGWSSRTGPWPT